MGGDFAADIAAATAVHDDVETVVAAENVLPHQAGLTRQADFPLQDARRALVFGPDEDDAVRGPDGKGRQSHALDEHVRLGVQEDAILEGSRFHFIGVADHIARMRGIVGHGLELDTGRKAGPAAAQ